jgi:hypothetical protein
VDEGRDRPVGRPHRGGQHVVPVPEDVGADQERVADGRLRREGARRRARLRGRDLDAGQHLPSLPNLVAGRNSHGHYRRADEDVVMKALRSFTVRPRLPPALAGLEALAMNLRWSWDERTRDLFRWVDPDAWEVTVHDPVALLARVSQARLAELEADPAFRSYLTEVHDALVRYSTRDRWFQGRATSPLRSIAYFSPEFGIAEALPQYSGGLGVLAGDHLKAASDLGVPLVGVGLFYRHGYFRQSLNSDGWQQERYPSLDPFAMALQPVEDVRVTVDLAGTTLTPGCGWPRWGASGSTCSTPTSRRTRRRADRHRPALRRRHRAPAAPGDPARHRGRAGPVGRR